MDPMEITHKHKYLGIDFYSHGYFKPYGKRWRILGMKALSWKKQQSESYVGNSNPIFSMLLCFQLLHMGLELGGGGFEKLWLESFWEGYEDTYDVPCQSALFDSQSHLVELPMELHTLKLTIGFQQGLTHLSPSWLVCKATLFFKHHEVCPTMTPHITQPHLK